MSKISRDKGVWISFECAHEHIVSNTKLQSLIIFCESATEKLCWREKTQQDWLTGGRVKNKYNVTPQLADPVGYNKPQCYIYMYVPFVDVRGFAVVDDTITVVVAIVVAAAVVGGGT